MGLERALWKSGWGTLIEARNSTVAHRVRAVKVLRLPLERAVFLHWNSKEGERGERKGAPWKKGREEKSFLLFVTLLQLLFSKLFLHFSKATASMSVLPRPETDFLSSPAVLSRCPALHKPFLL